MSSVLKDIYSKCLAQENSISNEISKVIKNSYPIDTIDRVKQKIKEQLENYNNSIELLEISLINSKISNEEKEIWKRKKEIFVSSYKNLKKRLDESIYNIKKKSKTKDYKLNLSQKIDESSEEFGRNLSNLQREKQSWNSVLKMSTEIQNTAVNVNEELDNQNLSLSSIGGKITNIFEKISGSYKDTTWIKQRGINDKRICLFLGVLTIVIIAFTYFYLRPKIRKKW